MHLLLSPPPLPPLQFTVDSPSPSWSRIALVSPLKREGQSGESTLDEKKRDRRTPRSGKPHNDTLLSYIDVPFYVLHTFRHGFRPTLHYACLLCAYSRGVDLWTTGNQGGERPRRGGIDRRLESKKNRRIPRLFSDFEWFLDSRPLQMNQIRTWFRGLRRVWDSVEFFFFFLFPFFCRVEKFWRTESKGGNRFRIENFHGVSAQWPNIFVFPIFTILSNFSRYFIFLLHAFGNV